MSWWGAHPVHELKSWPYAFNAVYEGRKGFEVRHDDRAFEVGHRVYLREYDPERRNYTGREMGPFVITYIERGPHTPNGLCVFSFVTAPGFRCRETSPAFTTVDPNS